MLFIGRLHHKASPYIVSKLQIIGPMKVLIKIPTHTVTTSKNTESLQKSSLHEYVQMSAETQFMKLLVSAIKSTCCVTQDILSIDPSKVNILDGLVTSLQRQNSHPPTKL